MATQTALRKGSGNWTCLVNAVERESHSSWELSAQIMELTEVASKSVKVLCVVIVSTRMSFIYKGKNVTRKG
jgi:hypothetical protein